MIADSLPVNWKTSLRPAIHFEWMIDNSTSPISVNVSTMKKLKSKSPFAKLKKALGHHAATDIEKNGSGNKSTKWDESGIISPTDSSAPLRANERTVGADNGGMRSRMEEEGSLDRGYARVSFRVIFRWKCVSVFVSLGREWRKRELLMTL